MTRRVPYTEIMSLRVFFGLTSICLVGAAQADLLYTFDSDNQGWRQSDFNSSTLLLTDIGPASWNSGGFIDGNDFTNWSFHTSPVLSGGFTGATEIRFDYSADFADAQAYPFLVLASSSAAVYQVSAPPADGLFHTYSYDLTNSATWFYADSGGQRAATMADISAVLAGLERIGINADPMTGADYTRVDNVRLTSVPEPASMLAVGLGLAVVLKRRRR